MVNLNAKLKGQILGLIGEVNNMMFPKDYSNTGGEFLCKSCAWCAKGPINNGVYCGFDREFHVDVGVCKDYKEKNNNG